MPTVKFCIAVCVASLSGLLGGCQVPPEARSGEAADVRVGESDLGGTVQGRDGPEAGVWVIAETSELPTKFAKIVVTDDRGRFVIPELPRASYSVWVRGYGLVDSPKVNATPGRTLSLRAVPAPNAAAAAEYYPPIYWYSMLRIPGKAEFPGTGPKGNGIAEGIKTQGEWLNSVKSNGVSSRVLMASMIRVAPSGWIGFEARG